MENDTETKPEQMRRIEYTIGRTNNGPRISLYIPVNELYMVVTTGFDRNPEYVFELAMPPDGLSRFLKDKKVLNYEVEGEDLFALSETLGSLLELKRERHPIYSAKSAATVLCKKLFDKMVADIEMPYRTGVLDG